MDLSEFFNHMTQDGLLLLESHFVSRISATDYIMKEKQQQQQNFNEYSSFVRSRSAQFTQRSLRASKTHIFSKQQHIDNTQTALSEQSELIFKKQHCLAFYPFVNAMMQCISVQPSVSAFIFAQLCQGDPQRRHPSYKQMATDPRSTIDQDEANVIFAQCYIYWDDLLNFLSTKTTIVEPPIDVRLQKMKCPTQFSHRLTVDQLQFLPELGVYFSSARDGLAHFWASNKVHKLLDFLTVDEFKFGLKEEHMERLVSERCDASTRRKKGEGRIDYIQTMSDVLNGKIPMDRLDGSMIDILPKYVRNNSLAPYTLITSLQNPQSDKTVFPLKNEVNEEEYAHKLTVACRVADAPLPSGFPQPQIIYKNKKFDGFKLENLQIQKKDPQLYKLNGRSKSTNYQSKISINQSSLNINDIDQLFNRASSVRKSSNKFVEYHGDQHPLFSQKKQGESIEKSERIYKQKTLFKDENAELVKDKISRMQNQSGKGNSWASSVCVQSDFTITIATNDRHILVYKLAKSGFEMISRIKINSIAVQNCIKWNRMLNKIKIDEVRYYIEQNLQNSLGNNRDAIYQQILKLQNQEVREQLIFCFDNSFSAEDYSLLIKKISMQKVYDQLACNEEDIPSAEQVTRIAEMIVYQSAKEIGFINYKTKQVVKHFSIEEVLYKRFQEQTDLSLQKFTLEDLSFTCIQCLTDKLVVGLNDGSIVRLDNMTLKAESTEDDIKAFNTQVSSISWSDENQIMVASSVSGQIAVYNYQTKADLLSTMQDSGSIIKIFISNCFDCIISVCSNGVISVWSIKSFTQLHKQFCDHELTCACWDEINGLLIVGLVDFQIYSIVGVKRQEKAEEVDRKQLHLPQAHYSSIVGILNMDITMMQNMKMQLNQIDLKQNDEQISVQQDSNDDSFSNCTELQYQSEKYRRKQNENSYTSIECQPQFQLTDQTPFSQNKPSNFMCQQGTESSSKYSVLQNRNQFINTICHKQFKMLDYSSLIQKNSSIIQKRNQQALKNTGQEVLQQVENQQKLIQYSVQEVTGFITIDSEANFRHWSEDGHILATYKLELDDQRVINAAIDSINNIVVINTNKGNSYHYKYTISETLRSFNVSNCAKSIYLLQFQGISIHDHKKTPQFEEYLKGYKPKIYKSIQDSTYFQNSIAYACGEFILLFNKDSRRLSGQFVKKLTQQNSEEALKLSEGLTNPPSMVLYGHVANVVCLHSSGKKLISADENGFVCCWLGLGISKGSFQVTQDSILKVFATYDDSYWGFIVLKSGVILRIENNFSTTDVFTFQSNGVQTVHICIFEELIKNFVKICVSIDDKLFICQISLQNNEISGHFATPCHHKISCVDFVNSGQQVCASCQSGHLFLINTDYVCDQACDQQLFMLQDNAIIVNPNCTTDSSLQFRIMTVSLKDKLELEQEDKIQEKTQRYFEHIDNVQLLVDLKTATEQKSSLRDFGKKESRKSMRISQAVVRHSIIGAREKEVLRSLQLMNYDEQNDE